MDFVVAVGQLTMGLVGVNASPILADLQRVDQRAVVDRQAAGRATLGARVIGKRAVSMSRGFRVRRTS